MKKLKKKSAVKLKIDGQKVIYIYKTPTPTIAIGNPKIWVFKKDKK